MSTAKAGGNFFVWAAAILPLTVIILWLITSISLPLGRDQGIFAWAGQTILNGGLPYADAWDVKGPAAHGLFALAIGIFGHSERAIRIFDILFDLLALAAFLRAGWLLNHPLAGLMAFILSFASMGGDWWNSAQPDGWAGILLCWSTVLLLERSLSPASVATASMLIGLAILVKPVYVFFAFLPLVQIVQTWETASWRKRLIFAAWAALGGLAPLCITFAIYALSGKAELAWETLINFNVDSHLLAQKKSILDVVHAAEYAFLAKWKALFLLLASGIGLYSLWHWSKYQARLLTCGVLAGALAASIQLKFYSYQLLPYFDQLATLAGYGFVMSLNRLHFFLIGGQVNRSAAVAALAAISLLPCLMVREVASRSITQLDYMIGQLDQESYLARFSTTDFNVIDSRFVADIVTQLTQKDERIYLWGFDALVYFLADRNSASRFGFNYPMVVGTSAHKESAKHELMETLLQNPPKLILVEDNDSNNLMPRTSRQYLDEFPELQKFIFTRYATATNNRQFVVYARRE